MDIVEELRTNREKGARRLEAEYKAGLMSLALRFCNDPGDAEELVNSTFATVVENIDDYIEQSAFFAWMCQILTSKVSRSTRRKSNQMEVFPGVLPEAADESGRDDIYRKLDASLLREAIDTLSPDIRKTLLMHYFMDFSVKDIARMLAVPAGTVTWRLHYARQILAAKLGATAKKPGVKALLVALALAALTAVGAAVAVVGGAFDDRAPTVGADRRAARDSGGAIGADRRAARTEEQPADDGKTAIVTEGGYWPPLIATTPFLPTTTPKEISMNIATRSAALGAASVLALANTPLAATGDGYQFIITGDPVAAATEGTSASRTTSGSLDVREHVVARSPAKSLSSIKSGGTLLYIK